MIYDYCEYYECDDVYSDTSTHEYVNCHNGIKYKYKLTSTVWLADDAYPDYSTFEELKYHELEYFDSDCFRVEHWKNIWKRLDILEDILNASNGRRINDRAYFGKEKIWLSLTVERRAIK